MKDQHIIRHREILAFVWTYIRRYPLVLSAMLLLLFLSTALDLIKPFFYKAVVDLIAGGALRDTASLHALIFYILLASLFAVSHLSAHELASRLLGWVVKNSMANVHRNVYHHVLRLSSGFHVNTFAGSTARKVGRGTDAIETLINRMWFSFLPLAAMTIGFIIVLSYFSPPFGIAIVSGISIYVPISIWMNLRYAKKGAWTDEQDTRVTASMVDTISSSATVKSFGREHYEDERHDAILTEWIRRFWLLWKMGNFQTWVQFMMIALIELSLMLLAARLWYTGSFSAGDFVLVSAYVGRLWGYMFDIGDNVRQYVRASAYIKEMIGLYRTPLNVSDIKDAKDCSVVRGAIDFCDVSFQYEGGSRMIFDHFSLRIAPGEKVALVGHSGGGKSTFVKLLQRLYEVNSGSITIDGQNIAEVTQQSLRRSIGLVPQDPILFHRSLAENIAYGKPDATLDEIIDAAQKAHAHEFISTFPKGYDTLVGERGVKLSGGERQRVAIARVILANTPILILDEATSSLDSLSERYIQDALEYVMRGRTTIVIAHRLSTIKKVDRILVIEEGRIAEEGAHDVLLEKKDGIYRGFYELQAGGFIGE